MALPLRSSVLLVAIAGAGVAAATFVLVPWLVCDQGAFGAESRLSCRLDRLREAPDAARYREALVQVAPLLDDATPSRLLLKAREALRDGLARGFNGGPAPEAGPFATKSQVTTGDLLAWIGEVFAERRARALQLRDELEPRILDLRVPVDSRIPVERFPVRATLVLWEAGESLASYTLRVEGGSVRVSKGDGGPPRVYAEPAEFRLLYDAASDGIGLQDWYNLAGLAGRVVVEG